MLQSCMPDSLTKYKKEEPQRTTASAMPPTAAPDLVSLGSFQLKNITQKDTSYYLHKYGEGNQNTACEIAKTDLGSGDSALIDGVNDIVCWLEAEEMQIFFNGADFQINTPIGLCEYTQIKPYYFWNAPPLNTNKIITQVTCDADPATCTAIQNAANAANFSNGFTTDENGDGLWDTNEICEGDYSPDGGANCDEGTITLIEQNVNDMGATSTSTSIKKCEGKRTACYAGPGVDFKTNSSGFPIPVNYLSYTGQSVNYSITAPGPLGKGFGSNHYISNYTQTYTTGQYTYDYTVGSSTTGMQAYSNYSAVSNPSNQIRLKATDPMKRADSSATKKYPVQPFYEFSCLNYAHEVKGRIRLQIREWNQKFDQPVTAQVAEASPAALIRHTIDPTIDSETSGVGYWNDVNNWDTPIEWGVVAPYIPPYPTDRDDTGFAFPYLGFNFN